MEKIYFYKLISPYKEDVTKNCKLTMTEMDENFLTFKNNDISGATYDTSGMTINIVRNDGNEINLDLSGVKENINDAIDDKMSAVNEIISGFTMPQKFTYYIGASSNEEFDTSMVESMKECDGTSTILYDVVSTEDNQYIWLMLPQPIELNYWLENGMPISTLEKEKTVEYGEKTYNVYRNLASLEHNKWKITTVTKGSEYDKYGFNFGVKNIDLTGSLSEDGVLTLKWKELDGESSTSISGFVASKEVYHTTTMNGDGTKENPLRISNVANTQFCTGIKDIVEELPSCDMKNGDRYVTVEEYSDFGCLYDRKGMAEIAKLLKETNSQWRIPTKEDWDRMLNSIEMCDEDKTHGKVETGIKCGKLAGKILKSKDFWEGNENLDEIGMTIFPSGYSTKEGELIGEGQKADFWTYTKCGEYTYYLKGFDSNSDGVNQMESENDKYSIRLVADYYGNGLDGYVNILGKGYEVIIIKDINQMWISSNLDFQLGDDMSDCFKYDNSTTSRLHTINHWNGEYWEKKTLENGNVINVGGNPIREYKVIVGDSESKLSMMRKVEKTENGNTRTIIDSEWY